MRSYHLFLLQLLALTACNRQTADLTPLYKGQILPSEKALTTIAFGSCNRQDHPQDMWAFIGQNDPQLWIWLGDNIYADTENMEAMEQLYQQQKSNPAYAEFSRKTPVIGIWDDHDFGVNDGGKEFPKREESKTLMLDFLDVPPDAEVRERAGAYQSYTFGPPGQRTKVLLLDARYFRDEILPNTYGKSRYLPNPEGDILGEVQWQWLEKELRDSDAQLHLIASGIQIIAEEQDYEKWANFPAARRRFFELLTAVKPAHTILLSGDRHIAELAKISLEGLGYPLHEITASGLTHTWSGNLTGEPNQYRIGDLVVARNFGLMQVDWSGERPGVKIEIRGLENKVLLANELNWKE